MTHLCSYFNPVRLPPKWSRGVPTHYDNHNHFSFAILLKKTSVPFVRGREVAMGNKTSYAYPSDRWRSEKNRAADVQLIETRIWNIPASTTGESFVFRLLTKLVVQLELRLLSILSGKWGPTSLLYCPLRNDDGGAE